MKQQYDLSGLKWMLAGWAPEIWRMRLASPDGFVKATDCDLRDVPAPVPGSVQGALRAAGILPDWEKGLNSRLCEWVENRHWIYETRIPDAWLAPGKTFRLDCQGLDYCGCIALNNKVIADFKGTHIPHVFDLTPHLAEKDNALAIIFTCAPRWLGQFGKTADMLDWKPRFYYTWDWTPRLVQAGIWDAIRLVVTDDAEITAVNCDAGYDHASGKGRIHLQVAAVAARGAKIGVTVAGNQGVIRSGEYSLAAARKGLDLAELAVEPWWSNGEGAQPLYTVTCNLLDKAGAVQESVTRRVGFRNLEWQPCRGAPAEAPPWLCVVNGKPVFLSGVNWTPIRSNFADVTADDYRKRLVLYRDLGFNILRVWGGASLEKECFYDLCDELGLMVWQEFPLSSSAGGSVPPAGKRAVQEMAEIALSYINRRQHHASLILWCGGNELTRENGQPADETDPMLSRLQAVVAKHDPQRRFLATSAYGKHGCADPKNYGKGEHWDVHGPWRANDLKDWQEYWAKDDALLRSETGMCGPPSAAVLRRYAGDCNPWPPSADNPWWRHNLSWWIEWEQCLKELGREPRDLEEYVTWHQTRQAEALSIAFRSALNRFPACGGMIFWMGHDCWPCPSNTSILDFEGNPKPAALAIQNLLAEAKKAAKRR